MSQRNIYHFLSSAARRQYAEDIIRALALPPGAHLQFRYSERLVADNVCKDIQNSSIVGSECLISFLNSNQKGVPPQVVPCRKGKIVKAGYFGSFAVIVFSVGDFVFSSDPRVFTDELRKNCNDQVPKWTTVEDNMDLVGHWAFSTSTYPAEENQAYDLSVFSNTVEQLSALYPFNEEDDAGLNPFFHVLVLDQLEQSTDDDFSNADLERSIEMINGRLFLKAGGQYSIRIHHYYPRSGRYVRKYARNLIVDLDGLAPQYSDIIKLRISSEYDVKEVLFKAISDIFTKQKRISIVIENATPNSQEGPFADIQIPVVVRPATLKGITQSLLIGFGVALPAVIGASVIPDVGFWTYFFMILSGLAAGFGAVYGLRHGL